MYRFCFTKRNFRIAFGILSPECIVIGKIILGRCHFLNPLTESSANCCMLPRIWDRFLPTCSFTAPRCSSVSQPYPPEKFCDCKLEKNDSKPVSTFITRALTSIKIIRNFREPRSSTLISGLKKSSTIILTSGTT